MRNLRETKKQCPAEDTKDNAYIWVFQTPGGETCQTEETETKTVKSSFLRQFLHFDFVPYIVLIRLIYLFKKG